MERRSSGPTPSSLTVPTRSTASRVTFSLPAGFCVYDGEGPFPLGSPECYARSKAKNYPSEGGAVILELDIPVDIARLSTIPTGDYQFDVGHGITELLAAWLTIEKRIRILDVNP